MGGLESDFQHKLIKELGIIFPGCVVLKNDAGYKKNIPDLTVFYKDHYALLEVKRSKADYEKSLKEDGRLNQEYYINKFNDWSFGRFIYPENKKEVLNDLRLYFEEGIK